MNQWQVAALQPPHLAAICAWEGATDCYRDLSHHGGILCDVRRGVVSAQIVRRAARRRERGSRSVVTGELVAGPETLSDEELAANRARLRRGLRSRPLDGDGTGVTHAGLVERDGAAALGRRTGAARICTCAATSRDSCVRRRGRSGSSARHRALDALLHGLRGRPSEALLRPFPHGRGQRAGDARSRRSFSRSATPGERYEQRHEDAWPHPAHRWTKLYLTRPTGDLSRTPVEGATSRRLCRLSGTA